MNKKHRKYFKKLLCWCCILSLCITSKAVAAINIGEIYAFPDGSLLFRVYGGNSVMVCGYNEENNSQKELDIETKYKLEDHDGSIYTDEDGHKIDFQVTGIEDWVFANNQVFKYINIKAGTGMKIGKSAFDGVEVQEGGVRISGIELTETGESAFANSNIQGGYGS